MAFPLPRTGHALMSGPGPIWLALWLLGAVALLTGTQAHAQGFGQLPDVGQAFPTGVQVPPTLFRLESESTMRHRMIEEARLRKQPIPFFPVEPGPTGPIEIRAFPPHTCLVEPSYVCYGPLYFEQRNAERYGWDLGPIHPFVSLAIFYFDVATLPYHVFDNIYHHNLCECSAGYCLPGDCVPLLLYKPRCSLAGILAEAATVGALLVLFP